MNFFKSVHKRTMNWIITIVIVLYCQTGILAQTNPASHSISAFRVTTYDGLTLPAQVIEPTNASNKLILFINGSTPYDEKGHLGAAWDEKCNVIKQKHPFYLRFLDIMSSKGYRIATMAKRSFVYPCRIPRPTLDELALDIQFFIWQLKKIKIIDSDNELVVIGYSEGSTVATKLLGLLKEKPSACILLGSGSSHFNFKTQPWQEWHMVDILRKTNGWTDQQIQKEYEEFATIMSNLVNIDEEKFEHEVKKNKPFGFGFAPWESYYIDREVLFYNCVPNLLDSNVPLLICIGEDDLAMPMVLARRTYNELVENGFKKATFKVIKGEVHQYKKYDVFAIMNAWLESDGKTTEFKLDKKDKLLIFKYENSDELNSLIASLSWDGGEPQKSIECFHKVKNAQYEDPGQWFTLGVKLFANGHYHESFESFSQATEPSFPAYFASMAWLGHLLDLQNRREEAILWYEKALEHYPGFPVQHSQWSITIDKKWLKERLKKAFTYEK